MLFNFMQMEFRQVLLYEKWISRERKIYVNGYIVNYP